MKTILVPVDFSDSAFNAATYAAELAGSLGMASLVLYHSNMLPTRASELPLLHQHQKENLELFRERLIRETGTKLQVDLAIDELQLTAGIEKICTRQNVRLIIMSTTGKGNLERMVAGSNTIAVARDCSVPLLLVPPHTTYKGTSRVALATDLKEDEQTLPVDLIERFVELTRSELLLINVVHEASDQQEQLAEQSAGLFSKRPPVHFIKSASIYNGLFDFVKEKEVECLIIIRKKHSFLDKLLGNNLSSEIAFHPKLPVLLLQQKTYE